MRVGVLGDQAFPAARERALVQRAAVAGATVADAQEWTTLLAEGAVRAPAAARSAAGRGNPWSRRAGCRSRCRRSRTRRAAGSGTRRVGLPRRARRSRRRAPGTRSAAGPLSAGPRRSPETVRIFVAEPRPQLDRGAAARNVDDGADAVVLRLVDQTLTLERRVDQ